MSARAALLETLASYLGDRKLLALIGTTVTGVALNAHSIRNNASFLSLYAAAAASPPCRCAAQSFRFNDHPLQGVNRCLPTRRPCATCNS